MTFCPKQTVIITNWACGVNDDVFLPYKPYETFGNINIGSSGFVRCLQIHFPTVWDITDLLIHKCMTRLSKFLSWARQHVSKFDTETLGYAAPLSCFTDRNVHPHPRHYNDIFVCFLLSVQYAWNQKCSYTPKKRKELPQFTLNIKILFFSLIEDRGPTVILVGVMLKNRGMYVEDVFYGHQEIK